MTVNAKMFIVAVALLAAPLLHAQGIKAGPWISDTSESSITVLWTSEVPGMAYVELEDGAQIYEIYEGRRIFRHLHCVKVDGLSRGQVLRYRICGQNIKDDSHPKNPVFGDVYEGEWHSVKTFDKKATSCRFSVFNDIHMRRDMYSRLAAQVDSAQTDFIFLNGDILSAGNYVTDTVIRYGIEPLGTLVNGIPLQFTRGNHEGRGNNPMVFSNIFPHQDPAPFYYTFRQGPVAFVVFDAGETHEKRSRLYCGSDVYEDYLNDQIEWFRKAMKEPSFRSAKVKVCLVHVPMIDHEDKTDFLLQRWLNVHMVPMLNKAGIDLMIGADLHEFMYCEPWSMGNDFPIIVADEARRFDFSYTKGGEVQISIWNPKGICEFSETWKP